MRINKDEARIVYMALDQYKYENNTTLDNKDFFYKIELLQSKFENNMKDYRRTGRTTQDTFTDVLKRFITLSK